MAFSLPALPYAKDALAPHISAETVEFHYEKHHRGYVTKLNQMSEGTAVASKSLEEVVRTEKGKIFNMAAQIWNHTFYWNSLSPNGGGLPTGKLLELINKTWGSFDAFKAKFTEEAANHFGSGWAWLVRDEHNNLSIESSHDAGCPLTEGKTPLLTCDVWEHAYYIDQRNNRPAYIEAWWKLVNWEFAAQNLASPPQSPTMYEEDIESNAYHDSLEEQATEMEFDRYDTPPFNYKNIVIDDSSPLDPNPSDEEIEFWGSSKGIDGWKPDFTKHYFPRWHEDPHEIPELSDLEIPDKIAHRYSAVATTDMPAWRYYATSLPPSEFALLKQRLDNMCPMKELKAIFENCSRSPEGRRNPSFCWKEKGMFVTCNEAKKRYLNNRQRLFYIYGSIKDSLREIGIDEENEEEEWEDVELDPDNLYTLRWEFYRLQYREAKRRIFAEQMKKYQEWQNRSWLMKLLSPSIWFREPPTMPGPPKHVKNYIYRGHHWLYPADYITMGPGLSEEEARTIGVPSSRDCAKALKNTLDKGLRYDELHYLEENR